MKKFKILIVLILMSLFTGCGGGSSDASSSIKVNVIGTWEYMVFFQNSVCDGKLAQGIEIIEPLNGDNTKIGSIILQGTDFALDGNQNCYLKSINKVDNSFVGTQSIGTRNEYLSILKQLSAGDSTIKEITVESFTDRKIITKREYTNGVIATSQITR